MHRHTKIQGRYIIHNYGCTVLVKPGNKRVGRVDSKAPNGAPMAHLSAPAPVACVLFWPMPPPPFNQADAVMVPGISGGQAYG